VRQRKGKSASCGIMLRLFSSAITNTRLRKNRSNERSNPRLPLISLSYAFRSWGGVLPIEICLEDARKARKVERQVWGDGRYEKQR